MAGLNETANAERVHIGILGSRNAGKSSLINAITGQDLAVVSDVKGTTTDPVSKAMELLPIGPVVVIDTPGFDDDDKLLGEKRVERVKRVLNKIDIAILVLSTDSPINEYDLQIEKLLVAKNIPYIIAINKLDLFTNGKNKNAIDTVIDEYTKNIINSNQKTPTNANDKSLESNREKASVGFDLLLNELKPNVDEKRFNILYSFTKLNKSGDIIFISSKDKYNINELKNLIGKLKHDDNNKSLIGDIVHKNDLVVLVTPIDESAPKGRMILPQVNMIRDILDNDAYMIVTKETELKNVLDTIGRKPDFVITDSQVFKIVDEIVPKDIPLTSFSILLARYKGFLKTALAGVKKVGEIKDGDTILISEGCTHHRQCNDIGTTKIPALLKKLTGANFNIETSSGTDFLEDLSKYKMIIHCGGCMVTEREMMYRMKCANDAKIPFTNYGIFIAFASGILDRSVKNVPIY